MSRTEQGLLNASGHELQAR